MRRALFGTFVVSAALSACGLDNTLGGSLSEVFPLELSRVEVAKNDEALQITYLRNRGVFLDVVIRLSVSLENEGQADDGARLELKPGVKIALEGDARDGLRRCAVSTAPGGEPVRSLPPIKKGDLVITQGGATGAMTKGHFSLSFEQEGGDVGFGRTLYGDFSGETRDAAFDD